MRNNRNGGKKISVTVVIISLGGARARATGAIKFIAIAIVDAGRAFVLRRVYSKYLVISARPEKYVTLAEFFVVIGFCSTEVAAAVEFPDFPIPSGAR